MTSPDKPNVGGITSLAALAQSTESGAKAAAFQDVIDSLFTWDMFFGGIVGAISGALGGSFPATGPGAVEAVEHLSANTQALIDDLNLLNGVPAYGAAYMSWNIYSNYQNQLLPFNAAIGPRKRVDIVTPGAKNSGGLTGYDPGLWEVSVIAHTDAALPLTGGGYFGVNLVVGVYDSPTNLLFLYQVTLEANSPNATTISSTMPFVIPEGVHHFTVAVAGIADAIRRFTGGTKYSGLWLRRISQDVENSGTSEIVSDGNAPAT